MTDAAEKAHNFREGYVEGAGAVLKAIGDGLPEHQMLVLMKWIDGPLEMWRRGSPEDQRPAIPMIDGA